MTKTKCHCSFQLNCLHQVVFSLKEYYYSYFLLFMTIRLNYKEENMTNMSYNYNTLL